MSLYISILRCILCIGKTLRYKNAIELPEPCVLCIFHDELIPILEKFKYRKAIALVSGKKIGRSLAAILKDMDYEVVSGSSSRRGIPAMREILSKINVQKKIVIIAVDGPSGPRHKMKPGAYFLAQKANVPLYLLRAEYKGIRLNFSWDKFHLPIPFSTVYFKYQCYDHLSNLQTDDYRTHIQQAEIQLLALIKD